MKLRTKIAAALRRLANRLDTPRVSTVPGVDWFNAVQDELYTIFNAAGEKSPRQVSPADHGDR